MSQGLDGTRERIVAAAEAVLRRDGFAGVSTRKVATEAGVPLSQIHYHFGTKRALLLALLETQNEALVDRQAAMYDSQAPLWKQWEQACDYYEDDLESGYVSVLQEMIAAGWSDDEIAEAVRGVLRRWVELLTDVAGRAEQRFGGFGVLTAQDVGVLCSCLWIGAESLQLLGMERASFDIRGALRRMSEALREIEESAG